MFSKYEKHINKIIFIFTFLCLLVFFFLIPGDVREYVNADYTPQVSSLLGGHYCLDFKDHLIDRHPPLTAFTFSLITKLATVIHVNPVYAYLLFIIIVVSVSNVLLYHIAGVLKIRAISIITCILFATCPFIGVLPLKLISEPMFILFANLALYLLIKEYSSDGKRVINYIIIGVSLGLCMLSRPIGLVFAAFFMGFILIAFNSTFLKKAWYSFLISLSAFIVILPWQFAMYKYNHYILPISSAGVYATRDGMSFNKKTYREKLALPADVDSLLQRFYKNYDTYNNAHKVHVFLEDEFVKSPITVLKLYYIKSLRFWYGTESQNKKFEFFNKLLISVYLALCIIGLFTTFDGKKQKNMKIFFILLILLNWFTAVMFLPLLRYLVPVIGILFILSAAGIWKVLNYFKLLKDH